MYSMDVVAETLQVLTTLFVLVLGLIAFMSYGALSKPAMRALSRGVSNPLYVVAPRPEMRGQPN